MANILDQEERTVIPGKEQWTKENDLRPGELQVYTNGAFQMERSGVWNIFELRKKPRTKGKEINFQYEGTTYVKTKRKIIE